MLKAYAKKPENNVGGSLYTFLNGNIEDGHVECCRQWALEKYDRDGIELCDLLALMSKTQRNKLSDMFWKLQSEP